jgi:hypothetical protein
MAYASPNQEQSLSMSDRTCPICGEAPQSVERAEFRDEFTYLCRRCGLFRIAGLRAETLPELIRTNGYAAVDEALRARIRKKNAAGQTPIIDSIFIDDSLSPTPPD